MADINVRFEHRNAVAFYDLNGKIVYFLSLPPCKFGCDVISLKHLNAYTYKFDGLIIITTRFTRKLFYKGNLIAQINKQYEKI
jgi:hypothetical protein